MRSKRPNILLITSDQQHWDTFGVSNPQIKTPALDRLAREGQRLGRSYCSNPVCSPSRSSIITGLYPSSHHCWTIGVKLPEDVPTVGESFTKAGYATALIGKAHFQPLASEDGSESIECQPILRDLDFWRTFHGPWYGFEHVETARMHADEAHAGQHYGIWLEENGLSNWRDYFQSFPPDSDHPKGKHSWDLPEEFHYTKWTGDRTIAMIDQYAEEEKPFFLWSSFHDPHPPYLVSEPWASMYNPDDMQPGKHVDGEFDSHPPHFAKTQEEKPDFSDYDECKANHGFMSHLQSDEDLRKDMAVYYGMVSFMDQQIGRILDALDRQGMAENTLVLFSTDHGHFLGQHGLIAKGAFHYEDLIRLPTVVRYPDRIPAGGETNGLVSQVDWSPTFLTAAGIEVPGIMQGVNQLDVWSGEKESVRDHIIVENRHQPTKVHLRTYVDERYKLTVYRDHSYGELFDLKEDPEELVNLWDHPEHQGLKGELMHRFVNAEMKREPTRMARIAHA